MVRKALLAHSQRFVHKQKQPFGVLLKPVEGLNQRLLKLKDTKFAAQEPMLNVLDQ